MLGIYPTEIDVLGVKLISADLPFVGTGALCAVIGYFLIMFSSSYLYEWSQAESERLLLRIREGRTDMAITRGERVVKERANKIIEKRKVAQGKQDQDYNRLAAIDSKIMEDDIKFQESQTVVKSELKALKENLAKLNDPKAKSQIEGSIDLLGKRIATAQQERDEARRIAIEDLDLHKLESTGLYEANVKIMDADEKELLTTIRSIGNWKRVQGTTQQMWKIRSFLEFVLPIIIGLTAIGSLIWLGFHHPDPKPISLPNF